MKTLKDMDIEKAIPCYLSETSDNLEYLSVDDYNHLALNLRSDFRKIGHKWKKHYEDLDREDPGCCIGGVRIDYRPVIVFITHFFNLEVTDEF